MEFLEVPILTIRTDFSKEITERNQTFHQFNGRAVESDEIERKTQ